MTRATANVINAFTVTAIKIATDAASNDTDPLWEISATDSEMALTSAKPATALTR